MKKIIFVVGLAVALVGCTDPDHAVDLLEKQGYTDVEITGYQFFDCSEDDAVHTGFRAKSPTGAEISGTVCKGLIGKNSTIRFD